MTVPEPETIEGLQAARGYFGIGIVGCKTPENLGMLWRSAYAFGADFLFTVGARYRRRQPQDTTHATRHVPLWEFGRWEELVAAKPSRSSLVAVEISEHAYSLPRFNHPQSAIYVLGAEDHGLSAEMLAACETVVQVPAALSLNVAVAGSLVLYDRLAKGDRTRARDLEQCLRIGTRDKGQANEK